jgi:hypothetical protein
VICDLSPEIWAAVDEVFVELMVKTNHWTEESEDLLKRTKVGKFLK